MPLIDFTPARAEVRRHEVLQLLGWTARTQSGAQLRGPCPVHGSRSPTSRVFSAHLGHNVWHCCACGAGGNALDLWTAVTGQPLYRAVLELCQRLGRPVPWVPTTSTKRTKKL